MGNTKIHEAQTQVYLNGFIEPQYGVDTDAYHLNKPPQQLLDIISAFYKSGKTDAQILSILVGMGTHQQLALSGIQSFKRSLLQTIQTNEKKSNTMNFTLKELYENVNNSIKKLDIINSDESRVSFSIKSAKTILESYLRMFPNYENQGVLGKLFVENNGNSIELEKRSHNNEINVTINGKSLELTENKDLLEFVDFSFSNIFEQFVNIAKENNLKITESFNEDSTLKFKLAKSIHRDLAQSDWIEPVKELRSYITDLFNSAKWSFKIAEAQDKISNIRGKLYENLSKDLSNLLNESEFDIKSNFHKIAEKNPWSTECKSILNEMSLEDKRAVSNTGVKINRVFSPVLETEDGHIFHLNGKNYLINKSSITETAVNDQRFFDVLEGLNMFTLTKQDIFTAYGDNGKSLDYNINTGSLYLGETDISNLGTLKLKESLIATNFFGYKNLYKVDKVCKFFESVSLLTEMDNFTNIQSTDFLNLYLTVISVEEGIWINRVNAGMKINEMKFINTATEAVQVIKEFINYDASNLFLEKLIIEGDIKVKLEAKRAELMETISYLESKKKEIIETINSIGKTQELVEALGLIDSEILKFEKEIQKTYFVSEKKTMKEYTDQGYVEAQLKNNFKNLKKDATVLIKAEDYSVIGDDDLINIIDPNTGQSHVIEKGKLYVKL